MYQETPYPPEGLVLSVDNCNNNTAMPTLNLFTNIPVDPVIASDILRDATKAVAKIIGKPESVEYIFRHSSFLTTSCLMKLLCR